jgi:hypothetical protein
MSERQQRAKKEILVKTNYNKHFLLTGVFTHNIKTNLLNKKEIRYSKDDEFDTRMFLTKMLDLDNIWRVERNWGYEGYVENLVFIKDKRVVYFEFEYHDEYWNFKAIYNQDFTKATVYEAAYGHMRH